MSNLKWNHRDIWLTAAEKAASTTVLDAGICVVVHDGSGAVLEVCWSDGTTEVNALANVLGGGGGASWGSITGTLSDQADLQAALDGKASASHTHPVADLSDASANAKSLLQAANYAAMRALLDLEPGVDFFTYTADGTTLELTGTQFAIKDGGVRTMQIADAVVTLAKIQDIGQNRMLGRVSSGSGVPEQLTPSQARDVLDVEPDGSTLEISSGNMRVKDAGVTLAKMANMATASLLGRNTAGTGVPEVLSASTVRALLDLEVGTDVQAYDSDLAAIAALSPSNDDILQRKSGAWTNRTVAQLAADMGRSSAVLGSDFTTSSAGPSDVTGWSLTLADPGTYLITIAAFVSSSNNSTGVSLSVTISGSPTLRSLDRNLYTAGTTKINDVVNTDDAGTVPTTMSGLNVPRPCMFVGMVKTSGSSATIQMRIARGGSSNNVSALAGSAIIAQKIA